VTGGVGGPLPGPVGCQCEWGGGKREHRQGQHP
jgi:hypothetical protein